MYSNMILATSMQKPWLILCLALCMPFFRCTRSQDLDIQHRSKGDPLHQRMDHYLMTSSYLPTNEVNDQLIIDFRPSTQVLGKSEGGEELNSAKYSPWQPAPFRDSPFSEDTSTEDPSQGESGISITVDDRTFDTLGMAVNKNMNRFVKSAAKDLRSAVDGAAKFMGESLQKTLAATRRPDSASNGGLLGFLGLSSTKQSNSHPVDSGSAYGVPQAPPVTPSLATPIYVSSTPSIPPATTPASYLNQVSTISSDYGVPRAPPVTSASVQNSFNTNFNDVRDNYVNDIGPSIQSLQDPLAANYLKDAEQGPHQPPNVFRPLINQQSTTQNPFLRTTTTASPSTTTPLPFVEPIYRPKRGKKPRPGIPPSPSARPTHVEQIKVKEKDRDFKEVKTAWYNYYRKAKDYTRKYREKVDVGIFKLEAASRRKKKQAARPAVLGNLTPSPNHRRPPNATPGPLSGKTRLQLPFALRPKHPTKVPLFTLPVVRSTPKPRPAPRPSSRPRNQQQRLLPPKAALNFNLEAASRKTLDKSEMPPEIDILHAPTAEMSYEILTPLSRGIDKSYIYYDEDYYFYNDVDKL